MPSPPSTRALLRRSVLACAVLFPGVTLVFMVASGCESTAHIDLPVYEGGTVDAFVLPLPDTGAPDTTTDASADAESDASADAEPDGEPTDGPTSDGPSSDGHGGDAEGTDARGDSASDAMKLPDGPLDGSTEADAGEKG